MKPINQGCLFLLLLLMLSACSVKNYNGPEMPEDQVATIELKRPVMSLVPLFWVFPLNMLTWYAEDWRETSWTDKIILEAQEGDESAKKISLDRFVTVSARPGLQSAESFNHEQVGEETTGSESCTSEIRSCQKKGDKDNQKTGCETVTTCRTPTLVTVHDWICHLDFEAKAGRHYELFIREGSLMLNEPNSLTIETGKCYWGPDRSYQSENVRTSTGSCT